MIIVKKVPMKDLTIQTTDSDTMEEYFSDNSLETAVSDTRNKTNLNGPFKSANSAVLSMLED